MGSIDAQHGEAFSIATLFYMRLRRVNARVIDVRYFIENKEYAINIIDLAEKTKDEELKNYIEKLTDLLNLRPAVEPEAEQPIVTQRNTVPISESVATSDHVTEEEIYKAQVSHHYIGALR